MGLIAALGTIADRRYLRREAAIKVLVIDDEPELVSMLVEWLSKMGHEAIGITGGKDVAHWVTKHKCDVVLLDLKLPDANGLLLIAPIRHASPTTKVIVITGIESPALAANAVKEGASHYFTKPIDFAALAQALGELSGRRTNIVSF